MLGQFLEFSFAARPLAKSFEFFQSVGFRSIPVGDHASEPGAAFYDGAIAIGLHDREAGAPMLTFVRPNLKDHVRPLRRLGIEVAEQRLAPDEFHQVQLTDPNGQPIRLLEARTFPPGDWDDRNVCACGAFLEYSLATDSIARTRAFWEGLGFAAVAAGDAPHPWLRLAGRGLVLGVHESAFRTGLSFISPHVAARVEYLKAKGLALRAGAPLGAGEQRSATLLAPDGTPLYLLEGPPGSAESAR